MRPAVRIQRLVFLCSAVAMFGCECTRPTTSGISGEVRWEWDSATGVEGGPIGRVDFPPTAMGARREQQIFVRNVGRAAFTMDQFIKVMGAETTLNLALVSNSAFEVRWDPTLVLNPTDRAPIQVSFTPPVTENQTSVDYESDLELQPQGAAAASLTLTGRATAGQCDAPALIDFGSVPLRSTLTSDFEVRNDGAAPVYVTTGGVTGAPVGVFSLAGVGMANRLLVDPNTAPKITITFSPSEPGDFMGEFTIQRAESCPQRRVQIKGRGVNSCITWKAEPPDDPQGLGLNFGPVAPSSVGRGKITFSNACSIAAELSMLRTSDPVVFPITAAATGDLTTLPLPASTRDAMTGMWTDGKGVTTLEFRPSVLGSKLGQLQASTSLASQPGLAVALKGFGGGPRIEVRPSPVFAIGRIGFTPNASPGTFSQRSLRVANIGNRPTPADPRANLLLGAMGMGPTYYSVRAINGTDDELCIGTWDAAGNRCAGTLPTSLYDPAVGIEATSGVALALPVRVIPATAGNKEWELTIYSNDVVTPEVKIRITAEAVVAPPCNYTVSPTTLPFGLMNVGQTKDLTFTLTNLGTGPTEICYFNGIDLSPTTHRAFSIVNNPIDIELPPSQSQTITVRATPTGMPLTAEMMSGEVLFNVSTPGAPQAVVLLTGTLAPACLTVIPMPVTFPDTQLECGSPERAVVITNSCSTSVSLNSVALTNAGLAPVGSGTCTTAGGCPQFALTSAPTNGAIVPGASRTVLIRYRPYLLGPATGELTVTTLQGTQTVPYVVPLNANGIARTMAGCGVQVTCPGPITVNANSRVTLTPTITAPGSTTCSWGVTMRPTSSSGTFSAPASCVSTTYDADVVGTHVVNFNVSDGLGGTAQCTTPITVNPNGDLWIELTWDRPNDMDLHLLHPMAGSYSNSTSWFHNTFDCNYRNRTPTWGSGTQSDPNLDRDDITGQGPENTRINTPVQGVPYAIGVHMYSWSASPSAVTSTVKLYCGGQLKTTQVRAQNVLKDMWIVGTVNFGANNMCTFTAVNSNVNVP